MLLDWQRSWSKAEGRLGDVEVTSSVGVLTVIGDQVVVQAGVSGFTVKAPIKAIAVTGLLRRAARGSATEFITPRVKATR